MAERMGGTVSTPLEAMTLCSLNNACSVSSSLHCIDADASHSGSVLMNFHGDTIVTRTRRLALRYERRRSHVSGDPSDSVFIHMNRGTQAFRGIQSGREWMLQPGEASLYVHNEPVLLESRTGGDFLGIAVPRLLTLDWADTPEDMVGRTFDTTAPEFRMLVPYLEFLSEGDAQNEAVTRMALKHAADLVQVCVGGVRDGDLSAQTYLAQQLRLIGMHMKRRMADPDLAIAEVAAALGLSVRTIQHVLTQNGTSFSRLLGKFRAEAAGRMLRSPAFAAMSVTAIAFECGFSDLSAFYRHFKQRHGMMPSEMRLPPG